MAEKAFEPTDPYELVGMSLPSPPGYDAIAEMGRCLVEEFALMGFRRNLIHRLFRIPFYAGAYMVYQAKGEKFVSDLIEQVLGPEQPEEANNG